MYSKGQLDTVDSLSNDSLLHRTFRKYIKPTLESTLPSVFGTTEINEYLLVTVIEETSRKMIDEHSKNILHSVDSIITFDEWTKLIQTARCADSSVSTKDAEVMLISMKRRSLIEYDYIDSTSNSLDNIVIKFVYKDKTGITESCKGIAKLKRGIVYLQAQIDSLQKNIDLVHEETMVCLKNKDRKKASLKLKKEKMLQIILDKRACSHSSLEEILMKIRSMEIDAEIVNIMEVASSSLDILIRKNRLTVERVEDVMDGLQDILANQKEIDDALTTSFNTIADFDEQELEDELSALAKSDENVKKSSAISSPSRVPDLLKELDSLIVPGEISPPPQDTEEALKQINQLTLSYALFSDLQLKKVSSE